MRDMLLDDVIDKMPKMSPYDEREVRHLLEQALQQAYYQGEEDEEERWRSMTVQVSKELPTGPFRTSRLGMAGRRKHRCSNHSCNNCGKSLTAR